jgi:zinc transporter 9
LTTSTRVVAANLFGFNNSTSPSWKYHYKQNYLHCRYFTYKYSDETKSPSSKDGIKALVESQTDPVADEDHIVHGTGSLDDIKLQVESMKDPKAMHGTIQKTQDDFADYLNGEEVTLDEDTGFILKKQNSTNNELNRQTKQSALFHHNAIEPSTQAESKGTNTNIADDIYTTSSEANSDPSAASNLNYQYIFTPKDATLSDRERYERRRRVMEQKLEAQQKESRAATYSNVQRALGGNAVIAIAKLAAALSSGSSAMMSEFVHSVVDCGNQTLLLVGLKSSVAAPDRSHPYGYGKAIYFWALVSALGTFFLGAGVSMTHAVGEFMNPHMTTEVPLEVWGVLGMSFAVDGYVFAKTIQGIMASKRIDGEQMSFWKYATTKVRDPATLAVLLEDGAACMGVVIAIGGIGMTQYTGLPVCDAIAGMGISALLGAMGLALVKVNHRFLIGQGLDKATRMDIERIILSRKSIDNIYSVQSQWTGPDTFSYKAEIDFDGTFLAAKLMPRYQQEFFYAKDTLDRDLHVLLSWYAEDIMRAAEREIRNIEEEIRTKYPAAQYIELEPMSKDADRYAIDDGMEAQLRRVEMEVLNRYLRSLYKMKEEEGDKEKKE